MGNTNVNIPDFLKEQAELRGLNISEITRDAIKNRLNIVTVDIKPGLNCGLCKRSGEKETFEDVRDQVREAYLANDADHPTKYGKLEGLTWLYPDEKWICNNCLRHKFGLLNP